MDIATVAGYAYRSEAGAVVCGYADMAAGLPRNGDHSPAKLAKMMDWVDGMIDEAKPDVIMIEEPLYRGKGSRILVGFVGVAMAVAAKRGIRVGDVSNSQWKKAVIGHGNADKADSISMCGRLGINVPMFSKGKKPPEPSSDAADAALIMLYAEPRS